MINTQSTEAPEPLIIFKAIVLGFLLSFSFKLGYSAGNSLDEVVASQNFFLVAVSILILTSVLLIYAAKRNAISHSFILLKSLRIDLFIFLIIGGAAEYFLNGFTSHLYQVIESLDSHWPVLFLIAVNTAILPTVFRKSDEFIGKNESVPFAIDEEVVSSKDDLLNVEEHAKYFAESVIESGVVSGLVYGIDGPWGIGKSSFINLAQNVWNEQKDLIVVRFEPLRYSNDEDLTTRLLKEVTAEIQKSVFAPEFKPVANRYSRLIRGKASFSIFGMKISLQPGVERIEDLISDIDAVLKRVQRRLVIVIDDLDRLDSQAINNVLFATRRTLKLTQATYVLCYDTEFLVGDDSNIVRSREFLEKFVTIKVSLFMDSSALSKFLRGGWQTGSDQLDLVPSDSLDKLSGLLSELADILSSDIATKYLPLVGNLRKVKRIINAMVSMRMESSRWEETDFNMRDLINLVLLHLNYPGVFRKVYAEETEGRSGLFSLKRLDYNSDKFDNVDGFKSYLKDVSEQDSTLAFLLEELFDADRLDLGVPGQVEPEVKTSRACFNNDYDRNLENYLKLIVRFVKPEPQETYVLYKSAFNNFQQGMELTEVLDASSFDTEESQDKFWRILINNCFELTKPQVNQAINYLTSNLPHYSSISTFDGRPLRVRSIYTLVRILDRVGWIKEDSKRRINTGENVEEIAWRIFGEGSYSNQSLIEILTEKKRGALGWFDLILFRLTCSADRNGQLYEISKALIYNQDKSAKHTGIVKDLTILEMRKLSQVIAKRFIAEIVEKKTNIYSEVESLTLEDFKGKNFTESTVVSIEEQYHREKSLIISFVMYQLANTKEPDGSGVGFGYYDFDGVEDKCGISAAINDYVFNFCFSPELSENNVIYFLDHCLSHLSNSFFSYGGDDGYVPVKHEIAGGFDNEVLVDYWNKNKDVVKRIANENMGRKVLTSNYTAFYHEDLDLVFKVLDELAKDYI